MRKKIIKISFGIVFTIFIFFILIYSPGFCGLNKLPKDAIFTIKIFGDHIFFIRPKIDFHHFLYLLKTINIYFIAVAFLVNSIGLFFRAIRWQYIVNTEYRISLYSAVSSICIGFMGIHTFPVRLGELLGPYYLSKREKKIDLSFAISTVAIFRIFDMLALLIITIGVLLMLFFRVGTASINLENKFTKFFIDSSPFFIIALIIFIIFFVLIRVQKKLVFKIFSFPMRLFPQKVSDRLIGIIKSFSNGLSSVKTLSDFLYLVGISILIWSLSILIYYFGFKAFSLDIPLIIPMFLSITTAVGIAIPTAPGSMGPYHFAYVYTLTSMTGMDNTTAFSMAIVMHLVSVLPPIIIGPIFLMKDSITIRDIANERVDKI